MQTVLIVIHFLIVIVLVGVVLIQPSEGGGLGVGGGSGFMSTRGTRNTLTRLTAILAICFFVTSIALIVVGSISNSNLDILNRIPVNSEQNSINKNASEGVPSPGNGTQPSILEQLSGASTSSQEQKGSADSATDNPVPPPVKSLNSDSE
ncbi:preprotein translocase subunit SecG [Bartonella bacilliformis]|uniref:preprotein translocase subunit SecG n=1 Tax=Bartonella bacilliformis TaxID=774 RepID=UPI0004A0E0F4|nr:preprotein translocase subunit SecG [Bartonella bacilliformis]KEG16620.1 preprotein translocase, SecG subunit [Bartonella bacilliformis Cond044]